MTRENLAAESQHLLPMSIGQQAVGADPDETVRQDVEEKPAEKLLAGQRQLLKTLPPRIVFPGTRRRSSYPARSSSRMTRLSVSSRGSRFLST